MHEGLGEGIRCNTLSNGKDTQTQTMSGSTGTQCMQKMHYKSSGLSTLSLLRIKGLFEQPLPNHPHCEQSSKPLCLMMLSAPPYLTLSLRDQSPMMGPALSPQPLLDLSTHPPRHIGTLPGLPRGGAQLSSPLQLEDSLSVATTVSHTPQTSRRPLLLQSTAEPY
jgi:hypothetical protein